MLSGRGLRSPLIAALGVIFFKDPVTLESHFWLICIIVGVVSLHLTGSAHWRCLSG